MPHKNWLNPTLVEEWETLRAFYGEDLPELVRQYSVIAEKCPMVLDDIEAFGFIFETSFVDGDGVATAYREGQRQMAQRVIALSKLSNEDFNRLEAEYGRRSKSRGGRAGHSAAELGRAGHSAAERGRPGRAAADDAGQQD